MYIDIIYNIHIYEEAFSIYIYVCVPIYVHCTHIERYIHMQVTIKYL